MKKYEQLAELLRDQIDKKIFRSGEKLPSIRHLSRQHRVSISTVQEAFRLLQDAGDVEARAKSGFYVCQRKSVAPVPPLMPQYTTRPKVVSKWAQIRDSIYRKTDIPGAVYLGMATPDVTTPTLKPLQRKVSNLASSEGVRSLHYEYLYGCIELRRQIAKIAVDAGYGVSPDEILITNGCIEAVSCSLRALTEPGDTVVVDSPCFYGSLQVIEALGLKALEIPTDSQTGISLEALELALDQWQVKACLLTPTFNNPLGYSMSDERKRALLALLRRYDIPLIEDDIYGDLSYETPRPKAIKSFDSEGRVILCSSFSKSLAPGLRVGWVAPGRYQQDVIQMKYVSSMSTSTLPQLAIAEFIASGGYDRHVRKMRSNYRRGRDHMLGWIERYFPKGTRVTCPEGGYLLWLELPGVIDTQVLFDQAMERGVGIAFGNLFTASDKYKNNIRLSYANTPYEKIEAAMQVLGELAKELSGTE
ncbi:MAG: PLP-dependent aminotransferase family protein [Candidatus Sedimenticola sp. (ex Thyasira tokunagai)]